MDADSFSLVGGDETNFNKSENRPDYSWENLEF